MALENNPYPQDVRVRSEAETLARDGHTVTVLAPRAPGQSRSELIAGVRVRRYRLPMASGSLGIVGEYTLASAQLTARVLAELVRGADVLHLHNPPDLLFPVGWTARALGRAVIFDHHDLAPELFEAKFRARWPAAILRWCERMTMRVAHVVIAANESHRAIALERGGVAGEQVVVVRNAPSTATVAARADVRAGVLREPKLCYVGSLGSQDGVRSLPEIVAWLAAHDSRPRLSVVGDGPELSAMRQIARERGVLDRIEFAGRVPHEDIPSILADADICLDVAPLNALNHRSTMIKIGEYLAAGRPIVTFALDETRRTAGDCALYAESSELRGYCEAIMRLCADERLRAQLATRALERAAGMTWESSAERLRDGYALAAQTLEAS